jgi:hypothetical protein
MTKTSKPSEIGIMNLPTAAAGGSESPIREMSMHSHDKSLALRLPYPEVLQEALDQASTFNAEEFLARLDRLARDLSSDPERHVDQVRLVYDAGTNGAGTDLASAWRRLCQLKAQAYRHLVRATRRDGLLALRYGSFVFMAALATSIVLDQWQPLPRWLNRPFVEGCLIASWVSLWRPFELLLYEWLPFGRMAKTFDRLADLSVTLAPNRQGGGGAAAPPGEG